MTSHEVGDIIRRTGREQGLRQDQLAAVAGVGVRFLVDRRQDEGHSHIT